MYDLTFGSEEWKQLDAGLVSRFDGNQAMLRNAKAAGREFEVQGVLDDWMHILRPRLRMLELVRRLKNHGYCVYYLSNIPQDVLELLAATAEMADHHPETPVITMSMGALGAVSRLAGETFGSAMTFANPGQASAPGQVALDVVNEVLDSLSLE